MLRWAAEVRLMVPCRRWILCQWCTLIPSRVLQASSTSIVGWRWCLLPIRDRLWGGRSSWIVAHWRRLGRVPSRHGRRRRARNRLCRDSARRSGWELGANCCSLQLLNDWAHRIAVFSMRSAISLSILDVQPVRAQYVLQLVEQIRSVFLRPQVYV